MLAVKERGGGPGWGGGRGQTPPTSPLCGSHCPLCPSEVGRPCSPLTRGVPTEAGLACPLHQEGGTPGESPPWPDSKAESGRPCPRMKTAETRSRAPTAGGPQAGRPPIL